ncbi:MAG: T9SS type A sorting domain-containing protein [Bacteroidota bacterium]
MNTLKKYTTSTFAGILLIPAVLQAQVAKKVVAEHCTNTKCSVCASRNPGFYSNLSARQDIFHIAIHPSSPYSACLLNQHNKTENDARTNYYGIYGATPRIVIQGEVVSTISDYDAPAIFQPYLDQTSPLSIRVNLINYSADSVKAEVFIKTMAAHALGDLQLFVSLVEKELNYSAPNGEQVHHDVFRKSFFPANGLTFKAAVPIGDSVTFTAVIAKNSVWRSAEVYALAIVNHSSDKKVVQSERSASLQGTTGISEPNMLKLNVYPSPAKEIITIETDEVIAADVCIYDLRGVKVKQQSISSGSSLNVGDLPNGIYQLRITGSKGFARQKIVILK